MKFVSCSKASKSVLVSNNVIYSVKARVLLPDARRGVPAGSLTGRGAALRIRQIGQDLRLAP